MEKKNPLQTNPKVEYPKDIICSSKNWRYINILIILMPTSLQLYPKYQIFKNPKQNKKHTTYIF